MSNLDCSCRCDRMLVRDGTKDDSARLHALVLSDSGRVEDALPDDCCNNEESVIDSSSFFRSTGPTDLN